jgi:hypothetical protein
MRATALAFLALLLVPAAGADARPGPPLEPFPYAASGEPVSDGVRYFVVTTSPTTAVVVDTVAKTARDMTIAEGCHVAGAAAAHALIACEADGFLVDLRDLSQRQVGRFDVVGKHWLGGTRETAGHPGAYWLNWRTGEQRSRLDANPRENDVDDPQLRRRLALEIQREPPFTLRQIPYGDLLNRRYRLVLDGPERTRLSACRNGCQGWTLGARLATWGEPQTARAFDARRRVRLEWTVERRAPLVVHTSRYVLVADRAELRLRWARVRR